MLGLARQQRGYGTKWEAIRARILKRDKGLRRDGKKAAEGNTAMLADMFGSLAKEAQYYAGRSDESYRAGMTCEQIYESVRVSNNQF